MTRIIYLTKGYEAIVDDEWYEKLSKYKWHVRGDRHNHPTACHNLTKFNGIQPLLIMHRLILNATDGMHVDHINHNSLDNRVSNLRLCTHAENMRNSRKNRLMSTSKYKGVYWDKNKKKWTSRIQIDGKRIFIGLFKSEVDAAQAYNFTALKYFGEFAYLNSGVKI